MPKFLSKPPFRMRGDAGRWWLLAYLVLSAAYVSLAMHVPVAVLTGAVGDDVLYWTHAETLLQGQWLGSYDQLTLAKGSGFSFVLAANFLLGTPITLLLALSYAGACFAVTQQLQSVGLRRSLSFLTYAVLLFLPPLVPVRIVRDAIYTTLVLLAIAGLVRIASSRSVRAKSVAWTAATGAALGLAWVTREEGPWLLPGAFVMLCLAYLLRRPDRPLRPMMRHTAAFAIGALLVVGGIALANYVSYGIPQTTDATDSSFTRALKALNSVQVGEVRSRVPVSGEQRAAIYEVSPAFRQLQPWLEAPDNGMRIATCLTYAELCGEYAGGWWIWALRDAAAREGYYTTPSAARGFFSRLGREVQDACEREQLSCKSNPIPLLPNVSAKDIDNATDALARGLGLLALQVPFQGPEASGGPNEELDRVRRFLGNPRTSLGVDEVQRIVRFEVSSAQASPPQVICDRGTLSSRTLLGMPMRQALFSATQPGQSASGRWAFEVPVYAGEQCRLSAPVGREDVGPAGALPLMEFQAGQTLILGDSTMTVDSVADQPRESQVGTVVLERLWSLYGLLLAPLLVLGVLSFVFAGAAMVVNGRRYSIAIAVAAGLWVFVATRLVLLAIIDATSFPSINTQYMGPAFAISVLATAVSLQAAWDVASTLRETRRRANGGPPIPREDSFQ